MPHDVLVIRVAGNNRESVAVSAVCQVMRVSRGGFREGAHEKGQGCLVGKHVVPITPIIPGGVLRVPQELVDARGILAGQIPAQRPGLRNGPGEVYAQVFQLAFMESARRPRCRRRCWSCRWCGSRCCCGYRDAGDVLRHPCFRVGAYGQRLLQLPTAKNENSSEDKFFDSEVLYILFHAGLQH